MSESGRASALIAVAAVVLVAGGGWLAWIGRDGDESPAALASTEDDQGAAVTDSARAPRPARAAAAAPPALAVSQTHGRTLDCQSPTGDAARVAGQPIAIARLCAELQRLGGASAKGVDPNQAKLLLNQLIDAALVDRALDEENVNITDADVSAALERLQVAKPGEVLRAQMRQRLALDKVVALRGDVSVSDHDIDAEVARGAPGIERGGGTKVEPWLVRVAATAPAEERARVQRAAEAFLQAVLRQQAPVEAAREHGMTALPPFVVEVHGMEPALEAAAHGLAPRQWSAAVPTRAGWVVLRGLESVAAVPISDSALRDRVRAALTSRKKAAEQQRILAALRAGGQVEVLVDL